MCLFRKTVKADLDVKRPTMDKLCSMSQDLLSSVKNREVASKLEARLDSFAQRWEQLVQILEMSITQVQWVLSCLLLYVESCEHHGTFFFLHWVSIYLTKTMPVCKNRVWKTDCTQVCVNTMLRRNDISRLSKFSPRSDSAMVRETATNSKGFS